MYQTLQYECADGIATVRFNRPGKLNAINPEMIEDLRQLVTDVRADPGARVLIFTGNGRAFSADQDRRPG
jgi:enoyl-CoA hydratase/carnithine racemase